MDESPRDGERARALVARLAESKAQAVAQQQPAAWVIGSDQVAVLEDERGGETVLGKPGTAAHCVEQLAQCAGRSLAFLTAVAVLRRQDASRFAFIDTTRVQFRPLDRAAIERYVGREAPLDCAGGFKSEGLGIALCTSIDGDDPTALIGLPLIRLADALRNAGYPIP